MNTEQRFNKVASVELPGISSNKQARVIAVSGGAGSSDNGALTINLAVALAGLNKQVCLLLADGQPPDIHPWHGSSQLPTLQDVIDGNEILENVMLSGPAGISIVPAASALLDLQGDDPGQQQLIDTVRRLESGFDYILIDAGVGVDPTVLGFILAAPENLIAITPEPSSLQQAFRLLQELSAQGFKRPLRLVISGTLSAGVAGFTLQLFASTVKLFVDLDVSSSAHIVGELNPLRSDTPDPLVNPKTPTMRSIHNLARDLASNHQSQQLTLSEYLSDYSMESEPGSTSSEDLLPHPAGPESEIAEELAGLAIAQSPVEEEFTPDIEATEAVQMDTISVDSVAHNEDVGVTTVVDDAWVEPPQCEIDSAPFSQPEQAAEPEQSSLDQLVVSADSELAGGDNADYLTAIHFAGKLKQLELDK